MSALEKYFSPETAEAIRTEMRLIARETQSTVRGPRPDDELTVKEVAEIRNIKERTVYDWVRRDWIIYHYTPGGHLRFYRKHVEEAGPVLDSPPSSGEPAPGE